MTWIFKLNMILFDRTRRCPTINEESYPCRSISMIAARRLSLDWMCHAMEIRGFGYRWAPLSFWNRFSNFLFFNFWMYKTSLLIMHKWKQNLLKSLFIFQYIYIFALDLWQTNKLSTYLLFHFLLLTFYSFKTVLNNKNKYIIY